MQALHQSEAAFMGKRRFPKSWGLHATVSFSPLLAPPLLFLFLLSSKLSQQTRVETLSMQAMHRSSQP